MKELIWNCYENLINIIQAFILTDFMIRIYKVKYWKEKPIITKIIGTILYAVMLVLSNSIIGFEGIGVIVFVLLQWLWAAVMLEGKWYAMLPVVMLEELVIIFVSTGVILTICLLTGIDGATLALAICPERFLGLILTQVLLAVCLKTLANVIKEKWNPLNRSEGKIFALVFMISLLAFFCITQTVVSQKMEGINKIRLLCACGSLIVLNVICFRMLNNLAKKRKIETENLLLKEQAAYQKKYAKVVKQQYDEMKQMRHDMKQHYSVLENLLTQEKYSLMEEYLLKFIESIDKRENLIYINNEYINAILNRKISYAREQNIDVSLTSVQEFSGVDEMELCNLLGNLMDNAVEACERVEGRRAIELSMSQDNEKIYVEIKNTIEESILKKNKELKTSKGDKGRHGYGMKTIREIVKKYEGHVDVWEELGKFCVSFVLYLDK
ncbi:MAG: GHKL domain-containing protein [Lachnospiraceae bacterium]|nr:GHKL domain-containing protein [Lachnospiraceae bacterium]